MKKKIFALVLAMTLIVTLFSGCGSRNATDSSPGFFAEFESETLDGKKVTEEIFKGNKVTMVNVWGVFCTYCIQEMPDLQKISENYKKKGVRVIGVLCDTADPMTGEDLPEKIQQAKEIVEMTGSEYTHILTSDSLNKAKLNSVYSYPTTYFLNENGELIGTQFSGARDYEQWSAILDGILEMA